MFVLDTNVVSEPLRAHPDPAVLAWIDRQAPDTLFLTTVSIAELWAGIDQLPAGKRRVQLETAFEERILPVFQNRVLGFGPDAARAFGRVHAAAQAAGNSMDFPDCAIAAIASSSRYLIATRNLKDYRCTGVRLLNPCVERN